MNFVDMSVGKVGVDFKCSIIIPKRCFVVLQTEMGISAVIIGKREMSFEEASLIIEAGLTIEIDNLARWYSFWSI